MIEGAQFAASLLTILLAHELGHFLTARGRGVAATYPYFIPLPVLSFLGTLGAVIRMPPISRRRVLLEVGAAGPLAGLVFAIPLYLWGIAHSRLEPIDPADGQLGTSLLVQLLDHFAAPTIPPGMDLHASPVAFGAWGGMFVTMINLIPAGQLDGGHIAYALFGARQNAIARVVHRSMLAFFFVSLIGFVVRDVRAGFGMHRIGTHVYNSLFWLVWFEVLGILGALQMDPRERRDPTVLTARTRLIAVVGLSVLADFGRRHSSPILWAAWFAALAVLLAMEARGGALRAHTLTDHPSTDAEPLGAWRTAVAIVTLVLFVLLFMPTPIVL